MVDDIIKEVAENIMAQSKSECPIETGTLQSSAYITNPVDWGDRVTIIMGYGGPKDKLNPIPDKITGKMKMASDYALAVHETPYYKHPYGKWKFLEDPVRAHTKAFIATLAKELRIVFAPGIKGR